MRKIIFVRSLDELFDCFRLGGMSAKYMKGRVHIVNHVCTFYSLFTFQCGVTDSEPITCIYEIYIQDAGRPVYNNKELNID